VRCYTGRFNGDRAGKYAGRARIHNGRAFSNDGGGKVRYQPETLTLAGMPVSREVLVYVSSESGMVIDAGVY
jgi:hypothetical protein